MSTKLLKLFLPHTSLIFKFAKSIVCKHDYEYWDTHLEGVNSDGSLTFIKRISKTHRKCQKCQKSQMFDMRPGKTGWKITLVKFPDSGDSFTFYSNPKGIKTIWDKREDTIDKILDC